MESLVPQPSGCVWDADFDAVIYADGSYEGDEMTVRRLQARRDGVAAGVKYWADKLAQEAVDKAGRETIRAEAERLKDEDLRKITNRCRKLECEYWRSIFQVDINVAANTRPSENSPPLEGYGGIVQTYARHEQKIEADVALKNLGVVFPLAALAEPGDHFEVLQVPRN
jgi:hypothetical protein